VTNFLIQDLSISERLFYYYNEVSTRKMCYCGKPLVFINFLKGFRTYCSKKCSNNADSTKKKIKKTKLDRYGSEGYNNNIKAKVTCLQKYGVDSYSKTDDHKDKVRATLFNRYGDASYNNLEKQKTTCLQKYGVDSYSKTDEFREKFNKTCQEKYDVNYYFQSDEFKEKKLTTCLQKYGVESYSKTSDFASKYKDTCQEKYGVDYYLQSSDYKVKSEITANNKYGVDHHTKKHWEQFTIDILVSKSKFINFVQDKTINEISSLLAIDSTSVVNYAKKYNCKDIIQHSIQSYPEHQIAEYIQETYDTKIIRNSRSIIPPKEIDIYLPEYNLAIEFNGIYWHSPKFKGPKKQDWLKYHANKEIACSEKGINLLHIWEDFGDHKELIHNAITNNMINNNLELVYEEYYI